MINRVSLKLKTNDLGRPSNFLGIEVLWNQDYGLLLRQTKLVSALLQSTGMESCNGIQSPLNPAVDLSMKEGEIGQSGFDCRSVIGSLLYLSIKTRRDIAAAVNILSRHVEGPKKIQLPRVKRVLRYLKETVNTAVRIMPNSETQLKVWVDASWGGEPGFSRKSRTGIIVKYADVSVYTASVLQKCTALSSAEYEFIALSEASKTISWIGRVLFEFGIEQQATFVLQDNRGSISWSSENI